MACQYIQLVDDFRACPEGLIQSLPCTVHKCFNGKTRAWIFVAAAAGLSNYLNLNDAGGDMNQGKQVELD